LCASALREAGKPVATRYVADYAMGAKELDVEAAVAKKVTEHVRAALMRLAAKGVVRKIVTWPDVWWELAS